MICIFPKPRFYCPSNLDLASKLREHGLEKWIKKDLWRLYHILSIIYRRRWDSEFDKKDFVPINSKILQKIVHAHKSRPALDALLSMGVIESDGHYRKSQNGVRGKSIGYRFAAQYNEVRFREVKELDYSKVSKHLLNGEGQLRQLSPEHLYLYECLKRITIDRHAKSWIECDFLASDLELDFSVRSVEFIEQKQWYLTVGAKSGRVFTNITNFPRELRPYLRLDGKPLAEVDISTCQPLLFIQMYSGDDPERQKYLDVILSGRFYEVLDEKLECPYGPEKRDRLKKAVLTQIFFDRLRPKQSKLCRVFAEMFPVLYSRIVQAKTPNHAVLAQKLQRDESEIMIGGVVRDVLQKQRWPIITIHDSILTFPEYASQVSELLKEHVFNKTGVIPATKIKNYAEDPLQSSLLLIKRQHQYFNQPSECDYDEDDVDELMEEVLSGKCE